MSENRGKLGLLTGFLFLMLIFSSLGGTVRSADSITDTSDNLDENNLLESHSLKEIEEVVKIKDSNNLDDDSYVFFDIGQSFDNHALDYIESSDGENILLDLDVINSNELFEVELIKGKNEMVAIPENVGGIRASLLIKLYPEIATISYYNEITKEQKSFANVFGGVGEDFIVGNGEFEIFVNRDIILLFS